MYYYLLPGPSKIEDVVHRQGTTRFISDRLGSLNIGEGMKWFSFGRSGLDFGREEWKRLMEEPGDLDNLTSLGLGIYQDCMVTAAIDPDPELTNAIEAMAHVVYHMTEEMDDDLWTDLVFFLQQRWRFDEQAFWESPETFMTANADVERSDRRNMLVELMLIEHGMLYRVRPAVFRLAWCMMISSGMKRGMGSIEENDLGQTLLVPTTFLEELVQERAPDFFDQKESTGMSMLLRYLRLRETGSIADEVVRSISSRTFWMVDGGVAMDLYLHAERYPPIEEERVAAWRKSAIHLAACMSAFNVMLVGIATAKGIDVRPERFGEKGDKKRTKQPSLNAASP
jgi:hypothetical protein